MAKSKRYTEEEAYGVEAEYIEPAPKKVEVTIDEPDAPIEAPIGNYALPVIGEIYVDDVEQLYKVIDVFTNSCVVEPVINKSCFACEIMSFVSMKEEGWKVIAKSV